MTECEHCGKDIRLEEGENKCPNCKKDIRYNCWHCKEEINPKEAIECPECGYYYCSGCDECEPECEAETKFQEYLKKRGINTYADEMDARLGGKNGSKLFDIAKHYFLLCEKLQQHEGRYCHRRIPITVAHTEFPRLMKFIKHGDKEWQERIQTMNSRLTKEWQWYKYLTVKGREGIEEMKTLYLLCCEGLAECRQKGKKIEFKATDRLQKCENINAFRGEKKICRKCGKEYPLDILYCPNCDYGGKVKKHYKLKLKKDKVVCLKKVGEFKKENGREEINRGNST